jgi:hypothetical protein
VRHFACKVARCLREPEFDATNSQNRRGHEQAQGHHVRSDSSSMFHFCPRLGPLPSPPVNESRTRKGLAFRFCGHHDTNHSMTPRHAAALALVGWYLMMPPPGRNALFDSSVPLAKWKILGSFDKAEDCETAYTHLTEKHRKSEAVKSWVQAEVCVATDDPRLAK